MTPYEHAMLGANLALAGGMRGRHGWGLVVTAGIAAALPDWDGLSIFFGPTAYATVHRVWGHSLLTAGLSGAIVGCLGCIIYRSKTRSTTPGSTPAPHLPGELALWMIVGCLAGLTHPPLDAIFSGSPGANWPVAAYWPFSTTGWAWPLVPWGDLGVTLIFVAEMFAIYRWPRFDRLIAAGTLVAVAVYVLARSQMSHA